ncbi:MAG: hypothetical protein ACTS6A_01910 [Candidatus Hodgkinia cicadicola]
MRFATFLAERSWGLGGAPFLNFIVPRNARQMKESSFDLTQSLVSLLGGLNG